MDKAPVPPLAGRYLVFRLTHVRQYVFTYFLLYFILLSISIFYLAMFKPGYLGVSDCHTVKKAFDIPVPSWDIPYPTLSRREYDVIFPAEGEFSVTSRLGTGISTSFFLRCTPMHLSVSIAVCPAAPPPTTRRVGGPFWPLASRRWRWPRASSAFLARTTISPFFSSAE